MHRSAPGHNIQGAPATFRKPVHASPWWRRAPVQGMVPSRPSDHAPAQHREENIFFCRQSRLLKHPMLSDVNCASPAH
eukprot:1156043-Pelagomonas_calceolata.AAC.16